MRFQKAMIEALEKRLKSPSTEDKLPGALRQLRESNAGTCAPPSLATTTIKQTAYSLGFSGGAAPVTGRIAVICTCTVCLFSGDTAPEARH